MNVFGLAFFGNHIVGPFYLPGILTGENTIHPALVEILEKNNEYLENLPLFQQDSVPVSYAARIGIFGPTISRTMDCDY